MPQETAGAVEADPAPPSHRDRGPERWSATVAFSLVGSYAALTIWLHARSSFLEPSFRSFSDSNDYREVAASPVLSSKFWTGVKPPGYPALVKLLGVGAGLHWACILLSVVAWAALALSLWLVVRNRGVGVVAVVVVLGLSLSERIQTWNDLFASESLSISLFVLALAAMVVLVGAPAEGRRNQRLRVTAWMVLGASVVWWALTRDSNAYVVLVAVVPVLAIAWLVRSRAVAVACGVALLVAIGCVVVADAGDRWVVPYDNVVFNRVLTDPDLARAWRDAGMPDSAALEARIGSIAYGGDASLFQSKRLAAFRQWVQDHGRNTYVRELLTRPSLGIADPVGDLDEMLTSPVEVWGHVGGSSYRGSPLDPVVDSLFLPDPIPLALWLLAVATAAIWLLLEKRRLPSRHLLWLSLALLVLVVPHLWLVWVGDAHNIARHAVTASVQLRVSGWLILLIALDELVSRHRRGTAFVSAV